MSQIRITVDEVGQVDLGGYLTKKVDAKPTVVARSSERKTEESGEDAEKKAELEKKAKEANHLAFMEDLGKNGCRAWVHATYGHGGCIQGEQSTDEGTHGTDRETSYHE